VKHGLPHARDVPLVVHDVFILIRWRGRRAEVTQHIVQVSGEAAE
jgi:hypothetical protein